METARNQGMRTILEGEAADELFYGGGVVGENLIQLVMRIPYPILKYTFGCFGESLHLEHLEQKGKPAATRRLCYHLTTPYFDRILTWLPAYDRKMRKKLLSRDFGNGKTYLCNDLLYKNKRITAALGHH